jgi:short-subunit dehydrogenase
MKKTILITGAGSGFGKMVAFDLAQKGHNVIATTQIWPQCTELINEAKEKGIKLTVDKLDVTCAKDRDHTCEKYDIDILFSNAGIMYAGSVAELPVDMIRSMFEVNLFGALELAQGFIKKMVAKKAGKIVFTSSQAGLKTSPFCPAYASSKHALEAIAEALHVELEPFGIKVATVNPGTYSTGFNERGIDSISHWYKPKVNFMTMESLQLSDNENSLDPQGMVDVMVDVILQDDIKFRNCAPDKIIDEIKKTQADAWTTMS